MTTATAYDLRIEVVLRSNAEHMVLSAGTGAEPSRAYWTCQCGWSVKGETTFKEARKHQAGALLAALDEAGVTR